MIIILDTNIIRRDFLMNSGQFAIMLDCIRKTHSRVILPKIVYDELSATYERELRKRLSEFVRARGSLGALLQIKLADVSITVEREVSSYLSVVRERLNVGNNDIFDYKESYLHNVLERAIRRKRPCTDRGEEIRDAVLWHCVLDIADEAPERSVIFISNNSKQFASNDLALHADLVEDCTERNVKVVYFTSLESFAIQHASNFEFITREWLFGSIDIDSVLEAARGRIESYAEYQLPFRLTEGRSPTGYYRMLRGSLDVSNFYVYEMADGSLRVELTLKGEVEVECEIEKIVGEMGFRYDYGSNFFSGEFQHVPFTRHPRDVEYVYEYLYPVVSIILDVTVENKEVVEWRIVDGTFENNG